MNIVINNYCNLSCEYCFAKDFMDHDAESMSIEDYKHTLEFLKRNRMSTIRFLGGEPTLHPDFDEMLDIAKDDNKINGIDIFTNGVFSEEIREKLIDVSHMKPVSLIFNYNDPNVIGKDSNDKLLENLEILGMQSNIKVTIGINFFKPDQRFDYIIDTALNYNVGYIRYSIAAPNSEEKRDTPRDYFNTMTGVIKDFLTAIKDNRLKAGIDCNMYPICMLDEELRDLFGKGNPRIREPYCQPVLDVKPNLDVIRCFAIGNDPVNLKEFDDFMNLYDHFEEKADYSNTLFEECKSCNVYKSSGQACSCIAFHKNFE